MNRTAFVLHKYEFNHLTFDILIFFLWVV